MCWSLDLERLKSSQPHPWGFSLRQWEEENFALTVPQKNCCLGYVRW